MMSRIAPRVQRTSFVSAAGGNWKCIPRSVPLVRVEGDVGLRDHRLQAVRRELVLAEGAREEPAGVLPALEVDDERSGELGLREDHPASLASRLRGKSGELTQRRKPRERLALELADPLTSQVELVPDRLERPRLTLEPEAKLKDPAFALG